jgi:hypothetical protein
MLVKRKTQNSTLCVIHFTLKPLKILMYSAGFIIIAQERFIYHCCIVVVLFSDVFSNLRTV